MTSSLHFSDEQGKGQSDKNHLYTLKFYFLMRGIGEVGADSKNKQVYYFSIIQYDN